MTMAAVEVVVTEFVILALACFFLIRYYKGNMVTSDVAIAVYLSWVLGFAGILLLPYDISVAILDDKRITSLEAVWNFVYWSTFVLAWIVLPIQMEYHNSGQFSFSEKMKDAVMKNFWSGVLAAVAGVVYVVYMMVTSKGSLSQVIGFVKAMSNTYGILLITVLMGNGLVGLPRRLWHWADTERELNSLYMTAPSIETSFQEARFELEDCEWDVKKTSERLRLTPSGTAAVTEDAVLAGQYAEMLQQSIADFAFLDRSVSKSYVNPDSRDPVSNPGLDTKNSLVELNARLKQAHIRARACDRRWKHLIRQCEAAELTVVHESTTTTENNNNWCSMHTEGVVEVAPDQGIKSKLKRNISHCHQVVSNFYHKICSAKNFKASCRFFSALCGVLSFTILWSELFMAAGWRSPVAFMMGAYSPQRNLNEVVIQAVSFLALSYMSICTYWSLFRLNLGWAFTLQGPQLSPPSSLIFNGEYFSRLQFALGYNFLMLLNLPGTKFTSFNGLMSNMTMVPVFGTSFTVYIPLVMIIVSLLTALNVNARILRFIGVESDDAFVQSDNPFTLCWRTRTKVALNDEDQERYEMGKKLVTSALRSKASARTTANSSRSSSLSLTGTQALSLTKGAGTMRMGAVPDSTRGTYVPSTRGAWLANDGKDEGSHSEEADDYNDDDTAAINVGGAGAAGGNKGFFSAIGGVSTRDGKYGKNSLLDSIGTRIQSTISNNNNGAKYSGMYDEKNSIEMHRNGMMTAPDAGEGGRESSSWTAKAMANRLTGVFNSLPTDLNFLRTTPPLSQGNSIDELESSSSMHKGGNNKDSRSISSSPSQYNNSKNNDFASKVSKSLQMDEERDRYSNNSNYRASSPHCNTNGRLTTSDNVSVLRSVSVTSSSNFGLIKAPDENNGNGSRRY